jgi:hypothetical protein
MDQPGVDKLAAAEPDAVRARASLEAAAREAVQGAETVRAMISALIAGGFRAEAARCYAHALPRREAVWWACMCARHTAPADLAEADREAGRAAELWVRKQNEESRRAAMARAEATGFGSPEAWAAAGAFWSGSNMAPDGVPPVAPAPHLPGVAVAGAVALADARGDAAGRPARLERFLAAAADIAAGGVGRIDPEAS